MIGFHLVELEMFGADGTNTLLPGIDRLLCLLVERAQVQRFVVACQQIGVNALLVLNLVIVD